MRLLELRANGADQPALEFHPNLTVVRGLSPQDRDVVIKVVESLPAGVDPGISGLVESHGVLFDLSPETLEIFGMEQPADVVIRATDLPVAGNGSEAVHSSPEPAPERAPEPEPAPAPQVEVAGTEAAAKLEEARSAYKDAAEAHQVMQEALDRAKLELAAASEARQRIMAALEQVRRERDLARAHRDGKGGPASDDGEAHLLRERIEELKENLAQIEAAICELEERDPRPIQVLLDALRQPVSTRMVPSEEANALADEFVALGAQLDELERRLQADGLSMDQLNEQLEQARKEVAAAEKAVAKPEASPEDIAELEAAHEEVLEAERRASSRVGRKAALKKLEEAQAAEQAILDRIGFPTWAAYIMGSSLLNVDPVAEQRLEQARLNLEQAEKAWADLTHLLEADPEYAGLIDRLEAVFLQAFDILGGEVEGDLEERLRSHMVPEEEISRQDLVDALIYQLSLRDIELDELSPEDVVVGVAEDWLAKTEDHWSKYQSFQQEHAAVTEALAAAERQYELAATPTVDETPDAWQRRYEEAEERVAEILADLEQATELEAELQGQVEARELLLGPAEMALQIAEQALREAEAAAGPSAADAGGAASEAAAEPPVPPSYDRKPEIYDDLPYASEDPVESNGDGSEDPDLEYFILGRLAGLRNRSHAGSVPIVLDDALAGLDEQPKLELMETLERMSEAVQIIYLSDDPVVVSWAEGVGFERAAVVSPMAALGS